jgi:FkbM family methyltransferase
MYLNNFNIRYSDNLSYNFSKGYKDLESFYHGAEGGTKHYFSTIIQPDWNIIDVGANIGMYSALFGQLSKGDIFLIEASHINMEMLKENLAPFGPEAKFIYLEEAFGDKVEEMESTIHYLWTGNGSVLRDTKIYNFNTIDNLLKDYNKIINLIKIDVDGFDYQVLKGTIDTLKKHKPIVMFELMEETLNMAGYNTQNVMELMDSVDYKVDRVLDNVNYIFTHK